MNKKLLIIIVAVIMMAAAAYAGFYIWKDGMINNKSEPVAQPTILAKDNFSIHLPEGWREAQAPIGVSAMIVNSNEQITDEAAKKINFHSYVAVGYDTLKDNSNTLKDYAKLVKDYLLNALPNAVFSNEKSGTINGKENYSFEAGLSNQGVNYRVMVVLIKGNNKDVWSMSFNTLGSLWDGYKNNFYDIINSFEVKK